MTVHDFEMIHGRAARLEAKVERLQAALTKIQYLEASDADTWIWTAQETAREALADEHGR
jgi:hypothetical protein